MTEITVHCDRCRRRIEADRSTMESACGPLRRRLPTIDLCGPCGARLVEWLADGPEAPIDSVAEDRDNL